MAFPSLPMSPSPLPVLYVKPSCPWCEEVVAFLSFHGVGYREVDITTDPSANDEVLRKSGQSRVPTLDWHGKLLADFGVDELKPFLQQLGVKLEDS